MHLLKTHGTYQQDDRDARAAARGADGGKADKALHLHGPHQDPGRQADQRAAAGRAGDLCDELGNTTLRITTRQGLQLHGVLKNNLQGNDSPDQRVQAHDAGRLRRREPQRDVLPAPHHYDPVHAEMQDLADRLAEHFAPQTKAYHEIWLTDPTAANEAASPAGGIDERPRDVEPIYGPTYLPRKFKTAIGLPGDNCVDMYANDLGFMAICENYKIVGYNVLVGGGLGVTPARQEDVSGAGQADGLLHARAGDRRGRGGRQGAARLRQPGRSQSGPAEVPDRRPGPGWFKAKVEEYFGCTLPEPHPDDVWGFDDHLGWHEQGDGRWFYGLNVENGRIKDEGDFRLKTALREDLRAVPAGHPAHVAPEHAVHRHATEDREPLRADAGTITACKLSHEISNVRRWSMACVAWPTCGLSITESERALPGIIDQLEVELAKLGLSSETFTVRMTGCPNGCARPYNSRHRPGRQERRQVHGVRRRPAARRPAELHLQGLGAGRRVVATLVPVLAYFKHERNPGETLRRLLPPQRPSRPGRLGRAVRGERQTARTARRTEALRTQY